MCVLAQTRVRQHHVKLTELFQKWHSNTRLHKHDSAWRIWPRLRLSPSMSTSTPTCACPTPRFSRQHSGAVCFLLLLIPLGTCTETCQSSSQDAARQLIPGCCRHSRISSLAEGVHSLPSREHGGPMPTGRFWQMGMLGEQGSSTTASPSGTST